MESFCARAKIARFERGRSLGSMNFPRMIPYIYMLRASEKFARTRFTGDPLIIPQVREARAAVYKQRLLRCVHGTLPTIILGRGNSPSAICLWNQLPVTSSALRSPAERNGWRRPSGALESHRKIRRFLIGITGSPTNESADFQFALRTRREFAFLPSSPS